MSFKSYAIKVVLFSVVIVSITIPLEFSILKFNTLFLNHLQEIYNSICSALFPNSGRNWMYTSDSTALYVHISLAFIISILLAIIPLRHTTNASLRYALITYCRYYLSLILIIYGCNKLFKVQFFAPHPNTIFTPLGQLTKDFMYWTTVGTTLLYNRITGIIEILVAISLWYKPTRFFGAIIAWLVVAHIVLINFSFDISVKVLSLFLWLCCTIVLLQHRRRLYAVFFKDEIPSAPETPTISKPMWLKIVKLFVIIIIVAEGFFPYISTNTWNGDRVQKPPHYGAYNVENSTSVKRFFIHSDPYFIIQTHDDEFHSFKMEFTSNNTITLHQNNQIATLNYKVNSEGFEIEGNLFESMIHWQAKPIPFKNMPIYKDTFHWTIESVGQ